jgi:glucosamine--fructose-6-phosphate aminotransferase (isomerizing)
MCGVFGYVGRETDVGGAILTALKTLEYRGYDSWGIAVTSDDGLIVEKATGRINGQMRSFPAGRSGIGHTRWATHGGVTVENAHPHIDRDNSIAVVHNGIIENHVALRAELSSAGHSFSSETDSEVVVHMVADRLAAGEDFTVAVAAVFDALDGYNAIVVLDRKHHRLAATKKVSPLVIGQGPTGATIASDAIALRGYADHLLYLEDDQIAVISGDGIQVLDRATLDRVDPFIVPVDLEPDDIDRGIHPDFMSKEMSEQPFALRRILREGQGEIEQLAASARDASRVLLVGCGTAANAALAGTYLFSEICGRDVTAVPASEFRYRTGFLDARSLVIAISQSGETIDVLEAMAIAKSHGAQLGAIVNAPNSSLDRMVSNRVLLRSGVEQCVLATKSYTAMLSTLLLTAFAIDGRWDEGAVAVARAADAIESMFTDGTYERAKEIADRIAVNDHLFAIGRGVHYASAMEAALKIKEVSYVHAEGFAAGELKHGVIALVEQGTPCLVFAPNDITRTDVLSGAAELRSRGGYMIGVGSASDDVFHDFVRVPDIGIGNPISEALPGQLLGYFAAIARGNDPDRPRNLAKSVTVK